MALYSLYLLIAVRPTYASDNCLNPGQVFPNPVTLAPGPVLNEMQRGTFYRSITGIFGLALQIGNFWLGFACVGLLIIRV